MIAPMRIIAGEFRSRLIQAPPDDGTRPMPDRVREALFNLLRGHCVGVNVYDGFAGSGSVGLEAISRGAAHCVFVERDKKAAAVVRANVDLLGVNDRADVVTGDALGPGALARARRPLHLAFLDPPYAMWETEQGERRILAQASALIRATDPDGFVVIRTPWPARVGVGDARRVIGLRVEGADGPETHEYGSSALHFFAPARNAEGREHAVH